MQLNYRDTRPIYMQIEDGFHEQIRSNLLQEGDRLPSVRELAAKLAINPNTIQRAYRELEAKGLIATVPGKGCFVCRMQEKELAAPAESPGVDEPEGGELRHLWQALLTAVEQLLAAGISREKIAEVIGGKGDDRA